MQAEVSCNFQGRGPRERSVQGYCDTVHAISDKIRLFFFLRTATDNDLTLRGPEDPPLCVQG
jgi:hypothetical protein